MKVSSDECCGHCIGNVEAALTEFETGRKVFGQSRYLLLFVRVDHANMLASMRGGNILFEVAVVVRGFLKIAHDVLIVAPKLKAFLSFEHTTVL